MEEQKEMNGLQILGYGLGSLGKDFANGVIGSYLLLFYTDVFGVPAAAAALIFLLTKIWDAVNDPMMGAIADRRRPSKGGKYRPIVMAAAIPLSIFCVLCFCSPELSTAGKIAYAAITYTITGMLFTAYDVPLWAMVPSLTKDENTKNKLISAARTFTSVAMMLATSIAYNLVQKLGGGSEVANLKVGYPRFMIIVGIVSVIFAFIAVLSTKERYNIEAVPQEGNIFKAFSKIICKPLILVLFAMMCCAFCMILPPVAGAYYMIYYLGHPEMIGTYMFICSASGIISSILSPLLLKKYSAKILTIAAFATNVVIGFAVFFIGKGSIPVLFVLFFIVGLTTGLMMVTITTMLAGTANYIAKKTGTRSDGACFSMNSFAIKVGQAVASSSVSFLLAATGYAANEQQSPKALMGILASRSLIPAFAGIIGIMLVIAWNVDGGKEKI